MVISGRNGGSIKRRAKAMERVNPKPEDALLYLLDELRQQLADLRAFTLSANLLQQANEQVDRGRTVPMAPDEIRRFV